MPSPPRVGVFTSIDGATAHLQSPGELLSEGLIPEAPSRCQAAEWPVDRPGNLNLLRHLGKAHDLLRENRNRLSSKTHQEQMDVNLKAVF